MNKHRTMLSNFHGKSQNLHFIRFIAALLVIFSHAFILSTGSVEGEWLLILTKNQISMGTVAVSIFFLCGGFLICKSVERIRVFKRYFITRVLRILPSLAFVTIIVVLVGVFFSRYDFKTYFGSLDTWKYLLNSIFILVHELPGVFENNIYNATVNGALWTLPVEFLCYIVCFLFYKMKFLEKNRFLYTIPIALVVIITILQFGIGDSLYVVIRPCILFYIGMLFWVYRESIELNVRWMLIAIIGLMVTIYFNMAEWGVLLFFPYIMFVLWFGMRQCSDKLGKLGNYSYGIYLWGFPVQQAVCHCMGGNMKPHVNMLVSVPISIFFGIFTYNFIEKRFFSKNVFRNG